jgi:ubiquinone/menaquinone biosynthesis C-methylase UbiE
MCTCQDCGARFPVEHGIPRLKDDALTRDRRVADEWHAQRHAHAMYLDHRSVLNTWEERVLRRILEWLGDVATPVLDVGCGVGHLGRVSTDAGRRVDLVGFDLMAELLMEAGVGYGALIEGDIHRMPMKTGSVPAMVLSNTLHHVADRDAALHELVRVLAPGGVVICYDPRRVALLEAVKRLTRRNHPAFSHAHYAFAGAEYRAMLEDAGLKVERYVAVDPFGPLLATGLDMVRVGSVVAPNRLATVLAAADRAVEHRDRRGGWGLMLLARARKPQIESRYSRPGTDMVATT